MRQHGTLARWNDDRGFGFITPAGGKGDLFVHISAFPRDGVRPRLGELISFEVEDGRDGKQRAVRVMRPGQRATRPVAAHGRSRPQSRRVASVLTLLVLGALGAYGYSAYERYARTHASPVEPSPAADASPLDAPRQLAVPRPAYQCDGRTMCSQMTSCDEATYFIRNCPNTEMDGDHDGQPCEAQWCN